MKNSCLKCLFTALLLVCSIVAMADTVTIGGITYDVVTKAKVATVIKKEAGEYSGSVVIPETVVYNNVTYSVTSIGDEAFSYCSGLTGITIPNSVTSIGWCAFSDCSGLTSITIPNSVTSIGDGAFYNCTSIKKVELHCTIVADWFSRNSSIEEVILGNSVTSIEGCAFSGCSGLTSITIPNSVTSIGWGAFERCSGLKEVHISDLSAWCNIDFGNESANPLYYAHNLYLNGELITDLVIPDDAAEIKNYAFYGCKSLIKITIPNNITGLGDYAFVECDEVEEIIAYMLKPIRASENVFSNVVYDNAVLYVPVGTKSLYEKREPWNIFFYIEEMDLTGIDEVEVEDFDAQTVIYDLQGRKVDNPTKGVYIVNGNKVLVK